MNPNFPGTIMMGPNGQVMMSVPQQASASSAGMSSSSAAMTSMNDGLQKDNSLQISMSDRNCSNSKGSNFSHSFVNGASGIGGLLQIAMQDAGITPSLHMDTSQQPSPAPGMEMHMQTESSHAESDGIRSQSVHDQHQSVSLEDMNHDALQTLASVASNTVGCSMSCSSVPSSGMLGMMQLASGTTSLAANTVTITSSAMSQNVPIMSVGQYQHQQQATSQANMMMGMSMLNPIAQNSSLGIMTTNPGVLSNPGSLGQAGPMGIISGATGPGGLAPGSILMNQQGQLLMINENGVPILMQQTMDPSGVSFGDKLSTLIGNGPVSVSSTSALMSGPNAALSILDHQQQALINSAALTINKSDNGSSSGLSSVTMTHPQSSILAGMNPQTMGQLNFLQSQLLPQGTMQSLAVHGGQANGFLPAGATINQQLMQSLGLPFAGMMTGLYCFRLNSFE